MLRDRVCVFLVLLCCAIPSFAQQSTSAPVDTIVPPLVKFSGTLTDVNGGPLTNLTGVTFYLYKEEQGGAPLFIETQNVQPDKNGRYTVMLGATVSHGLPADVFASGEARWLAMQPAGQSEKPRVLLLSVPYAIKALDAETLGGRPASAYQLAPPQAGTSPSSTGSASAARASSASTKAPFSVGGSGTTNYIPLWTSSSNIGNSIVYQSSSGHVGIATT